eukprot:763525-Hanusia_phi.AAC.5
MQGAFGSQVVQPAANRGNKYHAPHNTKFGSTSQVGIREMRGKGMVVVMMIMMKVRRKGMRERNKGRGRRVGRWAREGRRKRTGRGREEAVGIAPCSA